MSEGGVREDLNRFKNIWREIHCETSVAKSSATLTYKLTPSLREKNIQLNNPANS